MAYKYLYCGLTRAEAEAAHRALAGCPVKTPPLTSAIAQMAELVERWAKHDGDKVTPSA